MRMVDGVGEVGLERSLLSTSLSDEERPSAPTMANWPALCVLMRLT